ncbi:MAG: RES domain-containing protein [Candidatus Obscuribacterales bacterium]|nr:RES domain-containing protein [Candidatus Obscuribacterales bacterium]
MHSEDVLADVLANLPAVPINGTYHRSVANASLYRKGRKPKLLFSLGAGMNGARFTPKGGPPCLYVSAQPVTTLSEVSGIASSLVLAGLVAIPQPTTAFSMNVNLHRGILDLTNTDNLDKLGTTLAELDGPWEEQMKNGEPVPTQDLAKAVYESKRFQGLQFFSHEAPGQVNIMIWTETVKAPSVVEVIDGSGKLADRIPKIRKRRTTT